MPFGRHTGYRETQAGDIEMALTPAASKPDTKPSKPLPPPDSDFYQHAEPLNADDLALLKQVRAFMEEKVAPVIDKYWAEDAFPFELLPAFKELNIGGLGLEGYG
jgi:glutaryl-CoA dehydrogenase